LRIGGWDRLLVLGYTLVVLRMLGGVGGVEEHDVVVGKVEFRDGVDVVFANGLVEEVRLMGLDVGEAVNDEEFAVMDAVDSLDAILEETAVEFVSVLAETDV
jgi:hypothetical protein